MSPKLTIAYESVDASPAPAANPGDRIDAMFEAAEERHRAARRVVSMLLRALVYLGALLTTAVLLFLVGYILVNGVPYLTPSLFEWEYNSTNVSIMPALVNTLPVVMRTTEEALLAVPDAYREGGFGLGAGRLRTVFRCVLPAAVPGILGGVILALGRCVGEVAALIFTAGSIAQIPNFAGEGAMAVFDSARTLAVHMYALASEGLHVNETYATAVVLLVMVVLLNLLATFAAKKMNKGGTDD